MFYEFAALTCCLLTGKKDKATLSELKQKNSREERKCRRISEEDEAGKCYDMHDFQIVDLQSPSCIVSDCWF